LVVTTVRIRLGAFAGGMLAWKHQRDTGSGHNAEPSSDDVVKVIRFYLKEKGSGGASWSYPDLLREGSPEEEVEVELDIEDSLWREMRAEAASERHAATRARGPLLRGGARRGSPHRAHPRRGLSEGGA